MANAELLYRYLLHNCMIILYGCLKRKGVFTAALCYVYTAAFLYDNSLISTDMPSVYTNTTTAIIA